VNRRQVEILEYLREENRVLREQLGDRRVRFTDAQRRRLAVKGRVLGRRVLEQLAGLVTPDTILRWYRELIAKKYDGTAQRDGIGRGTTASQPRAAWSYSKGCHRSEVSDPLMGPLSARECGTQSIKDAAAA
jgi:putative transposase